MLASRKKAQRTYDEIIICRLMGKRWTKSGKHHVHVWEYYHFVAHYKGVDQRVRDHFITKEVSIGDLFYPEEN
jgi:tRNA (guanine37-N1)-methyltransferase